MIAIVRAMCLSVPMLMLFFGCDQDVITPPATPPPPMIPVAAADVIHLDETRGKPVQHLRKGGAQWAPAQKAVVDVGEKLFTPAPTTGMIRLRSGVRIAMNIETVVTFNGPSDITLERGEIWVARPLASKRATLTIRSKNANAVLEGVIGSARFDGAGLHLSVVSGRATLEKGARKLELAAGDGAVADAEDVRKVHIKDPARLVSWTKGLRDAMTESAPDDADSAVPAPVGLGTLTARLPGTEVPRPFEILSQLVSVDIQDHMARTRVEQVFRNPTSQVVEGEYKFLLPGNGKLVGYDMDVNGKMMQGEIVEKKKGRKIMKKVVREYLDKMIAEDPALTEWESGSTFKTRIFPIKAREEKRIVITYLQPLFGTAGQHRYTLPLSPGAAIRAFRVNARIGLSTGRPSVVTPLYPTTITESGDRVHVDFSAANFVPAADFVLEIRTPAFPEASMATYGASPVSASPPPPDWGTTITVGKEGYFMLQLTPELPAVRRVSRETDWMVLVDTSMNRLGPELTIETLLATSLLDLMGPEDRLKVIGFDTFPTLMDDTWRTSSETLKTKVGEFLDRPPGGATNIEGALRAAAKQAEAGRPLNLILITDGAATIGERAPGALAELAAALFPSPDTSLCTVGVGTSVDSLLLDTLALSVRGRFFSVSSGEDLPAAAIRIITGMRHHPLERPRLGFEGLSISDVLPRNPPNLVAGHTLVVTGRYRNTGKLKVTLSGTVAGRPWEKTYGFDVGPPKATNTFIPLFHASNQLDALTLDGGESARSQAVFVSKKFGIASRYTSFIVLENDAMYRRFKVAQDDERLRWDAASAITYEIAEADPESLLDALGEGEGMPMDESASDDALAPPGGGIASSPKPSEKMSAKRSSGRAGPLFEESAASEPLSGPLGTPASKARRSQLPSTPAFEATIWRPSATPGAKQIEQAGRLEAEVAGSPTSRQARRKLLRHLIRAHMLDRALASVNEWRAMDPINPEPYLFAAEIDKLIGDMKGAFRHFGSAIDLQPENRSILGMMAGYFESRGAFDRAAPFRAALAFLETPPGAARARHAVMTALMGDSETARRIATTLVDAQPSGYHQIKKGVALDKSLAVAVTRLADLGALPLDYNPFGGSRNGKVVITLEADFDAGLELWVEKDRDRFFGGLDDRGVVRLDLRGSGGMSVLSQRGDPGIYRIQVLCTRPSGCKRESGKVRVKAFDRRRTIPFTIENSRGRDIAVIRIRKVWYKSHDPLAGLDL